MKKKFLFSGVTFVFITFSLQLIQAQNTAPFWSLAGNSNTNATSVLGTTNAQPLRLVTNGTERITVTSAGSVGIGITSPISLLTLKNSGGVPVPSWIAGNSPLIASFSEGANNQLHMSTAANAANARPVYQGKRARGTLAAPSAVLNNDFLTSLLASGYDGSDFQNPATIDFFVDGAPSAGNVPTRISFVTGSNFGNRLERLRVGSTGNINFNNTQMFIDASAARVGIGTITPERKLHIFNGSAGAVTADVNSPLVVENSTANFIGVLAPSGTNRGILFGDEGNAADGGVVYSGPTNALQFRTNGNVTRMQLSSTGNLGVGGVSPFRKLEVQEGDLRLLKSIATPTFHEFVNTSAGANDFRLEHSAGNILYFSSSTNDFAGFTDMAYFDLNPAPTYLFTVIGSALASGGTWDNSDIRLKKEIKDVKSAMDIVKQLKPKTYFFKTDEYSKLRLSPVKQYGFIAQDLEKVLPEVVKTAQQSVGVNEAGERKTEELKAVNYTQIIAILTKAIQEQDIKFQEQETKMKEYETKIDELTRLVKDLAQKSGAPTVRPVKAFLSQNSPNPSVANSTRISYGLPEGVNKAELLIVDMAGRKLKQVPLNNSGNGFININTASLSKGTYTYSLFVNGVLADTKKMIVGNK